jgi:hypothetical protein
MSETVYADRLEPPPPPRDSHESVAAYLELLDLGDLFLRAGMRHQLGPDGDVDAAYQVWNQQQMEADTRKTIRMLEELNRREGRHVK